FESIKVKKKPEENCDTPTTKLSDKWIALQHIYHWQFKIHGHMSCFKIHSAGQWSRNYVSNCGLLFVGRESSILSGFHGIYANDLNFSEELLVQDTES
ncbi:hypothetical protein ACJX0J_028506, partial [Zea mays]